MTSVVIVDDHRVVAEGFARLVLRNPGFRVLGTVASGEELYEVLSKGLAPEVCILDLTLPGESGMEVLRRLHLEHRDIKVLVVSASVRPETIAQCFRDGALGFLSKFQCANEFLRALSIVARGGRYLDKDMFDQVLSHILDAQAADHRLDGLSTREFTVMENLAKGMAVKEIAALLELNAKTISTYRARMMRKLNVKNNAELTRYCLQHGVIQFETTS